MCALSLGCASQRGSAGHDGWPRHDIRPFFLSDVLVRDGGDSRGGDLFFFGERVNDMIVHEGSLRRRTYGMRMVADRVRGRGLALKKS